MPHFSRHDEFYCASLVTGPSSTLVRLRFAGYDDDHDDPPTVTRLAPVQSDGNLSDADVVAAVLSAVEQANAKFKVAFRVAGIQYESDNDPKCHLAGRAAYLIVARLVSAGAANFSGTA